MSKKINKTFPSNTTMDIKTFLNDDKIDGELYAYLLSISLGEKVDGKGTTYIPIEDLPTQTKIAEILNYKSRQTVSSHMKYLEANGYLKKEEKRYIVINPEDYFFQVPLETVQYFVNTVKEFVVKIYIYLGTRYRQKEDYNFTLKELASQLGINYSKTSSRSRISDALDVLTKIGLIKIQTQYINKKPTFVLTEFNLYIKDKIEVC